MSIASLDNDKYIDRVKASFGDVMARKALFKALSHIKKGRLVIEENGEVFEFGVPASNAEVSAHMSIHHPSTYKEIVFGGSIGSAEAYMIGTWSSANLVDVIRLMALNIDLLNNMDNSRSIFSRISSRFIHFLNANTQKGSRKNISAHYDLGNDFFELFLDASMMYSAAIFPHEQASLAEASINKLDVICKKLRLSETDHLLEIGAGWGGLALYAAKKYGCKVTTTTISNQQYNYVNALIKKQGLEDKITLLLQDYRDLENKYDKLVSVEMIEAVGYEYYETYFNQCSRLLKEHGLMLIQAITIPDQRYEQAKRSVDFIQRYIFPGGCLPSNEIIAQCIAKKTNMTIVSLDDIGIDYAKTLAQWRCRFNANLDQVKRLGFDDVFCRMWEFYLCYCEGGFTERAISTAQFVFAKPGARSVAAQG
jgi:cyclopropane-fatty-acyl-phospholipid synthase